MNWKSPAARFWIGRFLIGLAVGGVYSWVVSSMDGATEHVATVLFVAALFGFFVDVIRQIKKEVSGRVILAGVLLSAIALHVGILSVFAVSGARDSMLWMPDTYVTHLPGSMEVVRRLTGESLPGLRAEPFTDLLVTHWYVGSFFAIFGASPLVSGLALLLAKLGSLVLVYLLTRDLFGRTPAALASAIFAFMPTTMFYSLTFYKEAVIHFFSAGALWVLASSDQLRWKPIVFGGICLFALLNERFYLVPFLVLSMFLIFLSRRNRLGPESRRKMTFSVLGLCLLTTALFVWRYGPTYFTKDFFKVIYLTRENLNTTPDVDRSVNADLIYPVAVLKTIFTPYFSLRKFTLFSDFSFLLLWGSFLNQVAMAAALIQAYRCLREDWRRHVIFWVPVVGLILAVAYLAPYSGRQRDSFYPIIAVYAAVLATRRLRLKECPL